MTDSGYTPSQSNPFAGSDGVDIRSVISFFKKQPDFLAKNPQILASQKFPDPENESGLVDFQNFMVRRLRTENAHLREMIEEMIENGRDNISIQSFTLTAALALLNTVSPGDLKRLVHQDLPQMLDLDVCRVALERRHPMAADTPPSPALMDLDPIWMQPSTVDRLLGEDNGIHLATNFVDHMDLFAEARVPIRSVALVRIHGRSVIPPGLFVLGSRSAVTFHPDQGSELVSFLTRVLENCLYRFFEPVEPMISMARAQ